MNKPRNHEDTARNFGVGCSLSAIALIITLLVIWGLSGCGVPDPIVYCNADQSEQTIIYSDGRLCYSYDNGDTQECGTTYLIGGFEQVNIQYQDCEVVYRLFFTINFERIVLDPIQVLGCGDVNPNNYNTIQLFPCDE